MHTVAPVPRVLDGMLPTQQFEISRFSWDNEKFEQNEESHWRGNLMYVGMSSNIAI